MKLGTFLTAIAVVSMAGVFGMPRLTEETVTATVTNTMPKDGVYLVFTDKGTFKVEDTIAYFNYASSDVWGSITKNSTYEFTTTYWRIKPLSIYENIVKVKEITPAPETDKCQKD
tara:strand:- start:2229 stop:2573 length:345 start_codon:yes stop_codon:yes gene_type:complete